MLTLDRPFLRFQVDNIDAMEQDDVRQGDGARLPAVDPSELPEPQESQAECAAEAPPEMPGQRAPAAPGGADAAVTTALVTERTEAMVACEGGGPKASGRGPVAFRATYALLQTLMAGVEAAFSKHGEKVLRANCGGVLAKDEGYGFAYVDLLHGALAPRGNGPGCAIPLGEKIRKLNKKRQDDYVQKKRAAGKEPADRRAASLERVENWHRKKLSEECAGELAPFIPPLGRCAAVKREAVKREEAPPPPPPSTPPAASEPEPDERERRRAQLQQLRLAAESAHGAWAHTWAQCSARMEEAQRLKQTLDRRPAPKPPPRRRINPETERDMDEYVRILEAQNAAFAAYEAKVSESKRERAELHDMLHDLERLHIQEEAARAAVDAASNTYELYQEEVRAWARSEAEKCDLRIQLTKLKLERAENDPYGEREEAFEEEMAVWAVAPARAYHDMRGPSKSVPCARVR